MGQRLPGLFLHDDATAILFFGCKSMRAKHLITVGKLIHQKMSCPLPSPYS